LQAGTNRRTTTSSTKSCCAVVMIAGGGARGRGRDRGEKVSKMKIGLSLYLASLHPSGPLCPAAGKQSPTHALRPARDPHAPTHTTTRQCNDTPPYAVECRQTAAAAAYLLQCMSGPIKLEAQPCGTRVTLIELFLGGGKLRRQSRQARHERGASCGVRQDRHDAARRRGLGQDDGRVLRLQRARVAQHQHRIEERQVRDALAVNVGGAARRRRGGRTAARRRRRRGVRRRRGRRRGRRRQALARAAGAAAELLAQLVEAGLEGGVGVARQERDVAPLAVAAAAALLDGVLERRSDGAEGRGHEGRALVGRDAAPVRGDGAKLGCRREREVQQARNDGAVAVGERRGRERRVVLLRLLLLCCRGHDVRRRKRDVWLGGWVGRAIQASEQARRVRATTSGRREWAASWS